MTKDGVILSTIVLLSFFGVAGVTIGGIIIYNKCLKPREYERMQNNLDEA